MWALPPDGESEVLGLLRIGVARQTSSFSALLDLDSNGVGVRGVSVGLAQNRVLREDLVVQLGDQVVRSVFVVSPDLTELDSFHGHRLQSLAEAIGNLDLVILWFREIQFP